MSQNKLVINNGVGSTVRKAMNDALDTLVTNNLGAAEPDPAYAGMFWADNEQNLLKQRSSDNQSWTIIGPLNVTAFGIPPGGCPLPFHGAFEGKNPVDPITKIIYKNWHICDGTDGTIDLRDRFILGTGDLDEIGETGGEETHVLTVDEMPKHSHTINSDITQGVNAASYFMPNGISCYRDAWTKEVGAGKAHNNMPPYYKLAYIERIL